MTDYSMLALADRTTNTKLPAVIAKVYKYPITLYLVLSHLNSRSRR